MNSGFLTSNLFSCYSTALLSFTLLVLSPLPISSPNVATLQGSCFFAAVAPLHHFPCHLLRVRLSPLPSTPPPPTCASNACNILPGNVFFISKTQYSPNETPAFPSSLLSWVPCILSVSPSSKPHFHI